MNNLLKIFGKHVGEFQRYVRRGQYAISAGGILFPKANLKVVGRGFFTDFVNGEMIGVSENLMCDEGLNYFLSVGLLGGTQIGAASWYLGIGSGGLTPAANWTAANIASNATEITSTTQGYTEATRQAFTGAADTGDTSVNNNAALPTLTIAASAPPLTVTTAFLVSSNVRGGTAGTLIGATKYASDRDLNDGDTYNVQYAVDFNTP